MNNILYEKHLRTIENNKHGVTKTLTAPIKDGGSHIISIDLLKKEQLAQESANITRDIAVKYADWIANNKYGRTSMGVWRSNDKGYTTEELFDEFLKSIE